MFPHGSYMRPNAVSFPKHRYCALVQKCPESMMSYPKEDTAGSEQIESGEILPTH